MSSLEGLVKGSSLRIRPFQFHLRDIWDHKTQPDSHLIPITPSLLQELQWWMSEQRLFHGVSMRSQSPDLTLHSDASNEGWGATLDNRRLSGLWSVSGRSMHISNLELLAIRKALASVEELVRGKTVAIFSDNTSALSYIL